MIPFPAEDSAYSWAANWFLTYSVHSAVLGALGLIAARMWLAPGSRRSAVLKVALFGALFSASMPWKAVSPWAVMGDQAAAIERANTASPALGLASTISSEASLPASIEASTSPLPMASSITGLFAWGQILTLLVGSVSLLLVVRLALLRRHFISSLQREPLRDESMDRQLAAWAKEAGTASVALTGSASLAAPVVLSPTEICVPLTCWE